MQNPAVGTWSTPGVRMEYPVSTAYGPGPYAMPNCALQTPPTIVLLGARVPQSVPFTVRTAGGRR